MAVAVADVRPMATLVEAVPAADPAPLGLAGFALTTFLLSGHNATFIPDLIWLGPALFYGGTVQILAGMWEFRNRNVFGATAFTTYGGFWLALGGFVSLLVLSKNFAGAVTANPHDVPNALAWFLAAFAIFNLYMLIGSTRVSRAVFAVFLTLQITLVILAVGFFLEAHGHANNGWIHAGGWVGILTAACAWYASAAGVLNGMSAPKITFPVGLALWRPSMAPKMAKG
jgi:succinate-acetate transporter protein